MENQNEIWQVNVNGQIYETSFEAMIQWINDGSLLPQDKVRRGNLRWLEAGKTSLLYGFFNAKELGIAAPPIISSIETSSIIKSNPVSGEVRSSINNLQVNVTEQPLSAITGQNFAPQNTHNFSPQIINTDVCAKHIGVPPVYICSACSSVFCKACPNSYGSVKICPACGEMCHLIEAVKNKEKQNRRPLTGFGFMDFANALAYPFKFPVSLILGTILFVFFTIGQSVTAIGGAYLFYGAIVCAMLANTLTFGILSNAVENIGQGKLESDFMPSFDDFSAWDDVIHPFFLSIGVYLVSFGLFIILLVGFVWYSIGSIGETMKQPAVAGSVPESKSDLSSGKQVSNLKKLSEQLNRNNQFQNGEMPDSNQIAKSQFPAKTEEEANQRFRQEMLNGTEGGRGEQNTGQSNVEQKPDMKNAISSLLKTAGVILIPLSLALLWGLFYFPAACAVAGYTRSFTAVLNPLVGLDTIKRLGLDYVKILLAGCGFIDFYFCRKFNFRINFFTV